MLVNSNFSSGGKYFLKGFFEVKVGRTPYFSECVSLCKNVDRGRFCVRATQNRPLSKYYNTLSIKSEISFGDSMGNTIENSAKSS